MEIANMKQWYIELFANSGKSYDNESFTKGTIGECDFIQQEVAKDESTKILDIGCGTGRHAIELCKRGFNVVGIDLSEAQLQQARAKAENQKITFLKMDARYLSFSEEFELAIMLCEGAFPLMESDEMNYMILQGAWRALKPGGKFIFTTLNGLFPLYQSPADFCNTESGDTSYHGTNFDLMTFREYSKIKTVDDDGHEIELETNERYYVPSEITWLLKSIGFENIHIGAAKLGEFSRSHPLSPKDFEMLVICEKPI